MEPEFQQHHRTIPVSSGTKSWNKQSWNKAENAVSNETVCGCVPVFCGCVWLCGCALVRYEELREQWEWQVIITHSCCWCYKGNAHERRRVRRPLPPSTTTAGCNATREAISSFCFLTRRADLRVSRATSWHASTTAPSHLDSGRPHTCS
jgi:hypothetical protein